MEKKNRNTIIQLIKSIQWPKPSHAAFSAIMYLVATVITAIICSNYGHMLTNIFI